MTIIPPRSMGMFEEMMIKYCFFFVFVVAKIKIVFYFKLFFYIIGGGGGGGHDSSQGLFIDDFTRFMESERANRTTNNIGNNVDSSVGGGKSK
jgi:hypothetical protein